MHKLEKNITRVMIAGLAISVILMLIGLIMLNDVIMYIGIGVLIATPIMRVIASIISFAVEKDKLYCVITTLVLLILIAAIIKSLV
ncbi:MAG: DUF1634 domain-containing protein [Coriobacteriia bacterium]|nr:DUF1634 domain-containing protein [Coriobacteriia bacterium]